MKNKGITLLTLVITVIIMLILVGVTVNITNNNGATDKALRAADETEKATESEELQLAIFASKDDKTQEFNVSNLMYELSSDWKIIENTYYITCKSPEGNVFTINYDGSTYDVEKFAIYYGNVPQFIADVEEEGLDVGALEEFKAEKLRKVKTLDVFNNEVLAEELKNADTTEKMLETVEKYNINANWEEDKTGNHVFELDTRDGQLITYYLYNDTSVEPAELKLQSKNLSEHALPGEKVNEDDLVFLSDDLATIYVINVGGK